MTSGFCIKTALSAHVLRVQSNRHQTFGIFFQKILGHLWPLQSRRKTKDCMSGEGPNLCYARSDG